MTYSATFCARRHDMTPTRPSLGLLIMAASPEPDTQEELYIHSTSESESLDLSDSGDDLECIGVHLSPLDHQKARVNVMQLYTYYRNNSQTRTWSGAGLGLDLAPKDGGHPVRLIAIGLSQVLRFRSR